MKRNDKRLFSGFIRLILILSVILSCSPVHAVEKKPSSPPPAEKEYRSFGGPDTVPKRIEADLFEKEYLFDTEFMNPWYGWKEQLFEKYGYLFAVDYYPVALKATQTLPNRDDDAASAVFRFSGFWQLLGRGTRNTGTLVYLVEHRHGYTDTLPSAFALQNLGQAGFMEIPFGDDGWHLTNFYWNQEWNDGEFGIAAGFLDVTDWVDVWALTSPWTDFYNFVFSIGAATFDLPDDAALGFGAGAWLTKSIYVIGGFEDLNSDPTDPFNGFNTFWNDHEFFKHLEIGWSTSAREQYYLDNLHLTLWHADERDEIGIDAGWGGFLSFSHTFGDKWLTFARGGFAEDGGSLLTRSLSIGGGYAPGGIKTPGVGHMLGIGANWGRPNENLFGDNLDDQVTAEAYCRIQLTRELAITPDVQLLINPALNPDENAIWVFGIRARLGF
jgi:porin